MRAKYLDISPKLQKKNNHINHDNIDDFEFNQDVEFDGEIQSPGWKRYQKKLKSN